MTDREYVNRLEQTIGQMLKPLKGLCYDESNSAHRELLEKLKKAAKEAGRLVNKNGIESKRPNEVGNYIEAHIKEGLSSVGLKAEIPLTSTGKKKSSGYPDLSFAYKGIPYYLECKTYNEDSAMTPFRSFYLSPSDEMKVTADAVHFLFAFSILIAERGRSSNIYRCRHYKILSIERLSCDVKYEFNSDNIRLYSGKDGSKVLAEGSIPLE